MRAYQYAVLRCVPRVDREEFINVGVVVFCESDDFLRAACHLDLERLDALAPALDVATLREGLTHVAWVCDADPRAGEVSARNASQRFGFLKAPRSTVVQPSPVHGGMTSDPAAELDRLLDRLVKP